MGFIMGYILFGILFWIATEEVVAVECNKFTETDTHSPSEIILYSIVLCFTLVCMIVTLPIGVMFFALKTIINSTKPRI